MTSKFTDISKEESQENADSRRSKGEFVRGVSGFRNALGDAQFPSEPGRYHLFVAFNCPWCHRVTLARNILGLQNSITIDVAFPSRTNDDDSVAANLWEFNPNRISTLTGAALPECTSETATGNNFRLVKQLYAAEGSDEGSVPVLYDKKNHRIVSNESAEIIRMFNDQAAALGSSIPDADRANLYPDQGLLRDEIESLNMTIYAHINNGAYKAGFSSDQAVYASAFKEYFNTLSNLDARLAADNRPYLTGDKFTEADLRLFPTLYRHDP
ncbi:MAG: putative glutathione S-transferase, partial [Granulosicoccus sp.]